MKYIIRSNGRLYTAPAEAVQVSFRERLKRTGHISGLGPIMEKTGVDKSTVNIRVRSRHEDPKTGRLGDLTGAKDARGGQGAAQIRVKLLQRHTAIRILPEDADQLLEGHDAEIRRLAEQLTDAKKRRAATVEELWKRSEKVGISILEEMAS